MIDTVENDAKYLIMKRGVYYRPNNAGYTGIKDEAGRYSLDEISMRYHLSWKMKRLIIPQIASRIINKPI